MAKTYAKCPKCGAISPVKSESFSAYNFKGTCASCGVEFFTTTYWYDR